METETEAENSRVRRGGNQNFIETTPPLETEAEDTDFEQSRKQLYQQQQKTSKQAQNNKQPIFTSPNQNKFPIQSTQNQTNTTPFKTPSKPSKSNSTIINNYDRNSRLSELESGELTEPPEIESDHEPDTPASRYLKSNSRPNSQPTTPIKSTPSSTKQISNANNQNLNLSNNGYYNQQQNQQNDVWMPPSPEILVQLDPPRSLQNSINRSQAIQQQQQFQQNNQYQSKIYSPSLDDKNSNGLSKRLFQEQNNVQQTSKQISQNPKSPTQQQFQQTYPIQQQQQIQQHQFQGAQQNQQTHQIIETQQPIESDDDEEIEKKKKKDKKTSKRKQTTNNNKSSNKDYQSDPHSSGENGSKTLSNTSSASIPRTTPPPSSSGNKSPQLQQQQSNLHENNRSMLQNSSSSGSKQTSGRYGVQEQKEREREKERERDRDELKDSNSVKSDSNTRKESSSKNKSRKQMKEESEDEEEDQIQPEEEIGGFGKGWSKTKPYFKERKTKKNHKERENDSYIKKDDPTAPLLSPPDHHKAPPTGSLNDGIEDEEVVEIEKGKEEKSKSKGCCASRSPKFWILASIALFVCLGLIAGIVVAVIFLVKMNQPIISCFSGGIDLSVNGGKLYYENHEVLLKGVNWFGLETEEFVVGGLDLVTIDSIFTFLYNNSFNAIRVPVSVELLLTNPPAQISASSPNTNLIGKTGLEILDTVIQMAQTSGMLILLDMHRLNASEESPPLWYNQQFTEEELMSGWQLLVAKYGNQPNVFAADLFNEPFGACWGCSNDSVAWDLAATRIGNNLTSQTKWIAFVEGIGNWNNENGSVAYWAENFMNAAAHPVTLQTPNKRVYSPHVYGPGVHNQTYDNDPTFPKNMPQIWDMFFGYLSNASESIIIGEWGGFYTGKDKIHEDAFAAYLQSKSWYNTFWWCVNPESGDTGGLLKADWLTPETAKLNLLSQLQPNPTVFEMYSPDSSSTPQFCAHWPS